MEVKLDTTQPVEDTLTTEEETQEQTDNLILGKFKSQDDLVNAYKELESKLGKSADNDSTDDSPDDDTDTTATDNLSIKEKTAEEVVTNAGLDYQAFSQEFNENGELSEDTYNKLADAGIPKDIVDQYISGVQAQAELLETSVFGLAGGKDQYKSMLDWASKNLSSDEINQFNEATKSGQFSQIKSQVELVKLKMEKQEGTGGKLVNTGSGNKAVGIQPFRTMREQLNAQRDPRYKNDPYYQKEVAQRIEAGLKAGYY